MEVPSSISIECPLCHKETLHEVLSGRVTGKAENVLESTVRCKECSQVHHVVLRSEKPVEVPVIISWVDESVKSSVTMGPDEVLRVGDEFMVGELPVQVTSIESKGARVRQCVVRDIETVWGKRFEKVRVPVSVGHGGKTYSEHILAAPDEEFAIGDILDVGRRESVVHTIKTRRGVVRSGSVPARYIVRVYAHTVRRS
jgi:uncharacterized Zn finger protein